MMAEYIEREVVLNVPAADVVEVRHGEWSKQEDKLCHWFICSYCGERPPLNIWKYEWHSPYCPNCGAKMDGKE